MLMCTSGTMRPCSYRLKCRDPALCQVSAGLFCFATSCLIEFYTELFWKKIEKLFDQIDKHINRCNFINNHLVTLILRVRDRLLTRFKK